MSAAERRLLVAILAAALVLRLTAVFQSLAWNPDFLEPQMDALFHVEWARALAAGREHLDGPFFRAPLYPLFLAGIFKLCGDGLLLPRLVQAALGAATCGLVFLVARRIAGTRAALLSALLCAACPVLAFFDTELLLPVLECFCGTLALWLLLRAEALRSAPAILAAGLAIGAASIVRPNFLAVAAACGLWLVWRVAGWRLRTAALFALGCALPVAPVTLVNALEGDPVLVATQGGVNLWIGNNPLSDGTTAIVPGTRPDWWGGYEDSIAQAEQAAGRKLRASEVSSHYTRRVLDYWRDEPLAAARLLLWKLRLLASDVELGNNQDDAYWLATFTPVLRWLPARWWVLLSFGLLGLWVVRRSGPGGALLVFIVAYATTIVLFFVCSRFRAPLLPPLCIAAAVGALHLHDLWLARRRGALVAGCVFVSGLAALSLATPGRIDTSLALGPWQEGVAHVRHGDDLRALEAFDEALRRRDGVWIVHKDRALALQRLGRLDEALQAAQRACSLAPQALDAQRSLVALALQKGDVALALAAGRAAVRADRLSSDAHYDLGRVVVGLAAGGMQDAQLALEGAQALESGARVARTPQQAFNCLYARAELARILRDPQARLQAADAACALLAAPDPDGWFWRAHEQRLAALRDTGRAEEAAAAALRLLQAHPADGRGSVVRAYLR